MHPPHYYNEFDPNAAAWLRQLIKDKQIPYGHVDSRSITEVQPSDLDGFVQCHFFAGISGWSLALKLAGWPPDRPIWSASLPCQPWSAAGKQEGAADDRHLWPVFHKLVAACRPRTIFGEQVASPKVLGKVRRDPDAEAERPWLPGVFTDLENSGYLVGACDLPAAGVGPDCEGWIVRGDQGSWERIVFGAPHIRQRLFWVAHTPSGGQRIDGGAPGNPGHADQRGAVSRMAESEVEQSHGRGDAGRGRGESPDDSRLGLTNGAGWIEGQPAAPTAGHRHPSQPASDSSRLVQSGQSGLEGLSWNGDDGDQSGRLGAVAGGSASATGNTVFLPCRDGKTRRTKLGIFPLAPGLSRGVVPSGDPRSTEYVNGTQEARVMRLHGYGNAIRPQVAAEFITAFLEATA